MTDLTDDELGRVHGLLDHLGYDLEPSILIGGWATQLRVGGDVSRDIDLIIMDQRLRQKLRDILPDYSENTIHSGGRKGRGTKNGVHIDAYIPYESALGTLLRLRVDALLEHTEPAPMRGWRLLNIHAHTATKFAALLDRPGTEKGEKDAREIDRLLGHGADPTATIAVLISATGGDPDQIPGCVGRVFELIPTLAAVNKQRRRELAQQRRIWVDEADHQLALRHSER
ncbi:hypothetical protein GCM10025768_07640 [Microbacterium pseudoresistens]|uniref:Nucleotidyl transferase AbiEii/AbiGii toxin family protein n=1 Tax=Microbacterium pseudoresistens TaxID=640634 RepID=A0A7Y9EV90_9MICO|nr:hypothetical protein [Microbacterium pseudoresistens]NYD54602.1 hypothetical protein [Microbacterium pseudoresistens]